MPGRNGTYFQCNESADWWPYSDFDQAPRQSSQGPLLGPDIYNDTAVPSITALY